MKRSALLLLAALLTVSAAEAQTATKIKTKVKPENGPTIKTKTDVAPVVLDGPIRRIETLSGIEVGPSSDGQTIMLSFSQQFAKPGTLVVTNYKKQAVYSTPLDPQHPTIESVSLGHIPAGTYLVEARTGNYVYWKKVMVRYPSTARKRR